MKVHNNHKIEMNCSFLFSGQDTVAKGNQLIPIQNKQAVLHSYVAKLCQPLPNDVAETKLSGFKGRLNKYLKRELERVSKQTSHSGLKVPEPE